MQICKTDGCEGQDKMGTQWAIRGEPEGIESSDDQRFAPSRIGVKRTRVAMASAVSIDLFSHANLHILEWTL